MGPLMTKNFHTEAKIFLPGAIGPLPKGVTHTRRTVLGFVRRLRMYILCPRTYILNFRMYILNVRMEREEAVIFIAVLSAGNTCTAATMKIACE